MRALLISHTRHILRRDELAFFDAANAPRTPTALNKNSDHTSSRKFLCMCCRVLVPAFFDLVVHMFFNFLCIVTPTAVDSTATDDGFKLQPDEAALGASAAQRHPRHRQVVERRGPRHTLALCFVVFDAFHDHEGTTTLSPMPGQVALRRESGCSARKALPGAGRLLFGGLPRRHFPESAVSNSSASSI